MSLFLSEELGHFIKLNFVSRTIQTRSSHPASAHLGAHNRKERETLIEKERRNKGTGKSTQLYHGRPDI